MKTLKTIIFGIAASFMFSATSQAAVIVQNWNLTSNSLSFDLVGTVDSVGAYDTDSFFIGPANSKSVDWINNSLTGGTVTQNGGTYAPSNVGAYETLTYGEYVYTNSLGFTPITVGMTVDLSLSFAGVNLFNPSALIGETIFVKAGYDDYTYGLPDVGSPNTVPEPASIVLMGLGLAGIGFARKRKQS